MKRMLICCGALCMMLALFCVTAFAAVDVQSSDASVKVTKNADETQFTVTKESGATAGQLYLVMIQKGAATDLPTADNLYYVDVDKAEDAKFTKVAYPKNLDAGTYTVFLSDYGSANGGRKAVATLAVTASGGGGGGSSSGGGDTSGTGGGGGSGTGTGSDIGSGGETGRMKGDLDNDKKRSITDVMMLIKVVVNNEDATNLLEVADFDNDKKLTITDVMTLIRMVVNNE